MHCCNVYPAGDSWAILVAAVPVEPAVPMAGAMAMSRRPYLYQWPPNSHWRSTFAYQETTSTASMDLLQVATVSMVAPMAMPWRPQL